MQEQRSRLKAIKIWDRALVFNRFLPHRLQARSYAPTFMDNCIILVLLEIGMVEVVLWWTGACSELNFVDVKFSYWQMLTFHSYRQQNYRLISELPRNNNTVHNYLYQACLLKLQGGGSLSWVSTCGSHGDRYQVLGWHSGGIMGSCNFH